jgi:hypothetical protein
VTRDHEGRRDVSTTSLAGSVARLVLGALYFSGGLPEAKVKAAEKVTGPIEERTPLRRAISAG